MPVARFRPKTLQMDIPASEVPAEAWTFGSGIEFRNGFGRRSLGWARIFDQVPDDPQWIINAKNNGLNYWFAMCADGVYRTDGGAWVDVTPAGFSGSSAPNQWTGGLLNGILVFNCANNIDPPYYHDWNDNTSKTLPDWPANTTCKALRPFKFHIFAMDITQNGTNFPDQVLWSDAAAPGNVPASWTPNENNDAGDVSLSETDSPVIDAHISRGQLYLYKSRSVYVSNFVGGQFVFSFRILFGNVGVLARNCVQEFQGTSYVFADGDIYRHDGQNFRSIVWGRMQRTVFDQLDNENFGNAFVAEDRPNNEMYFCFPRQGKVLPDLALTYNVNTDSLGLRLIGDTAHMAAGKVTDADAPPPGGGADWDSDSQAWDEDTTTWGGTLFQPAEDGILMAQYTPGDPATRWIGYLDSSLTASDGTALETLVRKEDEFFEAPTEYKLVTRVWPRITKLGDQINMEVRVGASANDGAPVAWTGPYLFNPDEQQWIDCLVQGRFLSFELRTQDGEPYSLEGFDVEFEERGQF